MGMAPTAGRRVSASVTSVPAGVMGRPSLAGSCWPRALTQNIAQIKMNTTCVRILICSPFYFAEISSLASRFAASNLHALESIVKLFRNL
jgi:hypothetical protein